MQSKKKELLQKIESYKKKINEIDINLSRYLSDRKKYPHPGHESFINEVRRFENTIHSYPDKDVHYMLDNLMSSLRTYEKIWKQQLQKKEEKNKNPFSEKEIKKIYSSYLSIKKAHGENRVQDFTQFNERFKKDIESKLKSLKENEVIKVKYSEKTGDIIIKAEPK